MQKYEFSFIELFAGIGGFRIALESLGGQCVLASEMHPTARAVYLENWPLQDGEARLEGDIRLVPIEEVPAHDVLVGGFPCQPFSTLGKQDGLKDSRGRLFLQICRILRARQPKAALLENVPGLLSCDEGAALAEVVKGLEDSGYRVAYKILDSSTVLPQRRRRVYFVAIRADLSTACEAFRFPWLPHLSRCLSEVMEEDISKQQRELLTIAEKYWQKLQESRAYHERPEDIVARLDEPSAPLISGYGSSKSTGTFAYVTQFVPQDGMRPRLLSQRECARLQGFPESFRMNACKEQHMAWYKRIGNAVSVPVVTSVGCALLSALQIQESMALPEKLAGTKEALLAAMHACPTSIQSTFLARKVTLPCELGVASVAALLRALAEEPHCNNELRQHEPHKDDILSTSRPNPKSPKKGCLSLRLCCCPFL
jgi:DNA (cytosine-5)-methyltransferase 1